MNKRNLVISLLMMTGLFAQSIVGVVNSGTEPLIGANVAVEGTDKGGVTDESGKYTIDVGAEGTFTLTASFIGYSSATLDVVVGDIVGTLNFNLEEDVLIMSALEVLASRADENTPVAHTTVGKAEMEMRLGSQDLPMALNMTPSVYATQQGGGAGDARINVRGFNQNNVAVMINGVPQNDMENGWVYWSNWDGVADAAHSIQMQRGLSAVNLATPSIGGTMNIITDPAAYEKGGKVKQEGGAGGFLKTTLNYNSGLMMGDKLALSGTVVRKTGDGIIDGTWTDAWAYYFGSSYAMNNDHRFELYAIGAPQRHGHNLYKQNIATYSQELAGDVSGYDVAAFADSAKFETEAGRLFNQNVANVDASYTGKQYYYMYGENTVDRHDPNSLNERENYFHKPLVNLNHFWTINDKARLSSVAYWSGGSGGGTGTYGSVKRFVAAGASDQDLSWYKSSPWTWDWNGEIAENSANVDSAWSDTENRSTGILRNSINRQNTYGLISKLNYDISDEFEVQVGIDWRTASIEHAREVRDLLGGDYYVDYADDNTPDGKVVKLGDEIAYHYDTSVDWFGTFAQGKYTTDKFNVYGMGGLSTIAYSYEDHFAADTDSLGETIDNYDEADAITTFQLKGGGTYNLDDRMSVFANAGYVQKPPIMDNVIGSGYVSSDPDNEKFKSFELGGKYNSDLVSIKLSTYATQWIDRNVVKNVSTGQGDSGDSDIIFLRGVQQDHSGFEVESKIALHEMVDLDLVISKGKWEFVGDADGSYKEQEFNEADEVIGMTSTEYSYALNGLMVGDQPQTSYAGGLTVKPIKGLNIQGIYKMYDDNYADWSPDSREIGSDDYNDAPVWQAPKYGRLDIHASYKLPEVAGLDVTVSAHIFNALDEVYIQDAVDNSQYNGFGDGNHLAHNAEVFLGTPRYANVGISVNF